MWKLGLGFLAGVFASPVAGSILRPATRGAVKSTILIGRQLKKVTDEVREDLEDITAEAVADLDQPAK